MAPYFCPSAYSRSVSIRY